MTIAELIIEKPDLADADILAARQAQPVTFRRVPIEDVNYFLTTNFLNGKLMMARENPAMSVEIRAFLGEFLTSAQTAKSFDGTSEQIRAVTAQVLPVLVQAGAMTQEQADYFAAMMVAENPSADTLEMVAAERARIVRADLNAYVASLHNTLTAGIDDGSLSDLAAVKAKAIEVMA